MIQQSRVESSRNAQGPYPRDWVTKDKSPMLNLLNKPVFVKKLVINDFPAEKGDVILLLDFSLNKRKGADKGRNCDLISEFSQILRRQLVPVAEKSLEMRSS
jgi:hypothetical protein